MSKARQLADLGNVYDDGALSNRNMVVNGAMVIDQRNSGSSITPTAWTYSVDRFRAEISQASKLSVQQNAGSVTPPVGFSDYLGVTSLSSYTLVTGDYFYINTQVEGYNSAQLGWGASGAKDATLSFWVRSSLTGSHSGALRNGGNTRSYPFTFTVSTANTWEHKTVTIEGDISGTWATDNTSGVQISFSLGGGTTFRGAASAWASADYRAGVTGAVDIVGTNGATFYITGVQLEVGDTATPFEHRSYGDELARCERYFQRSWHTAANSGNSSTYPGTVTGRAADTGALDVHVQFRTQLRSAPTFTFYRAGVAGNLYNVDTAGTVSSVNLSQSWFDANGINGFLATGGPFTAGTRYGFDYDMDAEL